MNLDQVLEEWLYPIGIEPNSGFFSEEGKQESTCKEVLALEGVTRSNQASEGAISALVVLKCSDGVEEPRVKLYYPLVGVLYKKDNEFIVTWSGTDPDSKMNFLFSQEG